MKINQKSFGANFPEIICNDLLRDFKGKDFSKALIIFPHKRPKFFIEKILANKLKEPFYPPVYFDMDLFICYLSEIENFTNDFELLDLVLKIFENEKEKLNNICQKPLVAIEWALYFIDASEKIQMELIEYEKIKTCPPPDEKVFFNFFPELYKKFLHQLKENNFITRGMAYNKSAREGNFEKLKDYKKIYFVVPPGLTNSEKEILAKIKDFENLELYIENFDIDFSDKVKIIHKEQKKEAKFDIIPCSSSHAQVLKLKEKIKKIKDEESIAIVLPRARELLPLLENVLNYFPEKEFNISLGYPLIFSPFYKLIEDIFSVQIKKFDEKYNSNLVLKLLLNPLIYNLEEKPEGYERKIKKLKNDFIEKNIFYFTEKEFLEYLKDDLDTLNFIKKIMDIFISPFKESSSLKDLCENIFKILNLISKNIFFNKNPFSYEYLEEIYKFLYELEQSNFSKRTFEKEALFEIFLYFLKKLKINFKGHPLKGWQVLGFLETRTLAFENVFLLNLNEGVLPSIQAYDPVIPLNVKKELGLPGPKEEEEIYKHHFLHLVNCCKTLTLFYLENEEEDIRSRFLEQLIWEKEKKEKKIMDYQTEKEFNLILKHREPFKVEKSDEIIEYLKNKSFSATSIDTYLKCPLQFYFRNVLNLKETLELEEEADALTYGNVTHKILEILQKEYIEKKIKEKELEEMNKKLENVIENVLKEKGFKENLQNKILKELIKLRIEKFLNNEKAFPIPFKIIALEKTLENVIFNGIKLKGRIDRVDLIGEIYRAVDYKTGSITKFIKNDKIKDPKSLEEFQKTVESFQMVLYLYFLKKEYKIDYDKADALFYSLKNGYDEKIVKDVEKAKEYGENYLKNFLEIIFDKSKPFEAAPKDIRLCPNCAYFNFCK